MLTILRVFLDYVACLLVVFFFLVSSFFVKLVFYCVAIDNYYLCFGTVPKVTKIFFFFKPPWGQEMAPFHGCILFFSSI